MSGLDLGFSVHDMKTMKFAEFMFFVRVKTDGYAATADDAIRKSDDKPSVRDATQQDIANFFL